MKLIMPGNNFNQRGLVHLPSDICRTIIGGGGHGGYHAGNEPKVLVKSKKNAWTEEIVNETDLLGTSSS